METVTEQEQIVLNQVYRECLDSIFCKTYYQSMYNRTIRYAKSFDYMIGLGSAASGGTGLGILATRDFAWICGPITTISILLSVAKGVWDWAGKSKFALDRVQFYDDLYGDYQSLVDDLNAQRQWSQSFSQRRDSLRNSRRPGSPDPYPELSDTIKRRIQNGIKKQLTYRQWWEWKDAS